MTDYDGFLIGGRVQPARGTARYESMSSVDDHVLGTYPIATAEDVDAAVAAARVAIAPGAEWSTWSAEQRALAMESLATALKSRVSAIGDLIAEEVGSPVAFARNANAVSAISQLRLYANVARQLEWETRRPARLGQSIVRRERVGVVAAIVPWNFPLSLAIFKLGPALAAGCSVVLKPSSETGLSSYLLADAILESDLPAGVVNIVPADRDVSEHLVGHPGVDKISFTGSTATGRRIASIAGASLTPVTLELGGKSAAILLPDADLETFIAQLPALTLMNNGQTCTIDSRVLVPSARAGEFTEAITARVAGLSVGSPLDESVDIGPLVSPGHRARVQEYISIGLNEGARVTTGGTDAPASGGAFVTPTVFDRVTRDMRVAQEEIFGPVVSILEYDGSDDDAVALANDTEFGLAGTVWSTDLDHAIAVARRVESGVVGANVWNLDLGAPFGGRKSSGLGYELGPEAVDQYLLYKSIYTPEGLA
jgi:aldehyde dehydrogenase (NAD+)